MRITTIVVTKEGDDYVRYNIYDTYKEYSPRDRLDKFIRIFSQPSFTKLWKRIKIIALGYKHVGQEKVEILRSKIFIDTKASFHKE